MFKIFGKSTAEQELEDEELYQATRALNLRMQNMLEQENLKRIRFATPDRVPSYYR